MIQSERVNFLLTLLLVSGVTLMSACSSDESMDHDGSGETVEEAHHDSAEIMPDNDGMQDENVDGQKSAAYIDAYLKRADDLVAQGKLKEAKLQVMGALSVDANNVAAKSKLQEISGMMGDGVDGGSLADQVIAHKTAMRSKQVAEVNDRYVKANHAFERGELDDAKKEIELAHLVIRYDSFQTNFGELAPNVKRLGSEIDRRMDRDADQSERTEYEEAYRRLKAEEERDQARRAKKVRAMMVEAYEAFERQDFDQSEHVAAAVLEIAPSFRNAKDLVQMSRQARSAAWRSSYFTKRREQMQTWKDQMRDDQVPWTSIIKFPSRSVWDKLSRDRKQDDVVAASLEDSELTRALKNKLATETVTWDFEDMPLREVVTYVRDTQNVNILTSKLAFEEKGEEPINFSVRGLNFADALKTALEPLALTYTFKNNAIFVVGLTESAGAILPRVYEVRDLTIQLPDFRPPNLTLRPGPAGEASAIAVFGEEGEPVRETEPEQLLELVRDNVDPTTWEIEGRSLELSAGQLVAVTTPEVHQNIQNFLEDLRRFTKVIVHVETRVIAIREGFLSQIGVDIRGLGGTNPGNIALLDDVVNGPEDNASGGFDNGGPGLPAAGSQSPTSGAFFQDGNDLDFRARTENIFNNALGSFLSSTGGASIGFTFLDDLELGVVFSAVEKSAFANVLTAPRLTIYNNQRANLTLTNQIAYVKDYDVEVAQTAFIADPLVDIVQDGLVLDVRPTVSHDRKYVTLELRPTVAILARPIQTFVTPLAGLTTNVIIELPEIEYRAAATTVRVPDRGWVVIGGLKNVTTVDRRSETPILSQIPILSFFFSKKGRSDEISDLIILLNVRIIDLEEEEARLAR
ncbi:MAG: tetratricopeptide (TPR) repeat protein [Planctomycetota bacterium]|jgi:tetratricopeptide (TPR) repeat protein